MQSYYPFYTAFLPETRAYQILTSMLEGNGKDIYNRAGIMAGKVKPPSYLRYCPICAKEDMEKYGEMYWHRIHQISGIEICLDHFVWLNNSTVKVQGANKHIAYAASIKTCDLNWNRNVESSTVVQHYQRMKQDIEKLLSFNLPRQSKEILSKRYKLELQRKGFASIKEKVDQIQLRQAFLDYYGEEFLNLLQSSVIEDGNWLEAITRKHRKSFYPLQHLLFIHFLGLQLSDVFEEKSFSCYQPFGEGPWLCLNPFCHYYKQHVIKEIKITSCEKNRRSHRYFYM
ncbi:TnsD family Tn7-like transposition protein [Parageobacillus thermoglucosidasius]|uniref:TnsD family Tn7-like transposition protein n=1 Tax=Parageobacillus thermoglucosidasius TaxID=1426 RepID=UPI003119F379